MRDFIKFLSDNDKFVTAWTAIIAVLISFVAASSAVVNTVMQRSHNRKTVLPIGHFSVGDYENRIFVSLRNDGVGPMIIDGVSVQRDADGKELGAALIDLMPDDISWTTFVGSVSGRALAADKYIYISHFAGG
jgi:hypothetical protein